MAVVLVTVFETSGGAMTLVLVATLAVVTVWVLATRVVVTV